MKFFITLVLLFGLATASAFGAKLYFGDNVDEVEIAEKYEPVYFPQPDEAVVLAVPEEPAFDFPYKIKAPDFVGLENWFNSQPIDSLEELRGKVVYLKFWTYACINCVNTLPTVQALHEKYLDEDVVVIGIHAPEFQYDRKIANVKAAAERHGLTFPIVQDNDFKTWRAYNNRYWPALYLIDKEGYVRYTHFGEGNYEEIEEAVVALLES